MNCNRCGRSMNAQAAFCMQCGHVNGARGPIAAQTAAMPMPQQTVAFSARAQASSGGGSRGGAAIALWVVGALACVLAVGVGAQKSGLIPSLPGREASLGAKPAAAMSGLNAQGNAALANALQAQGSTNQAPGLMLAGETQARSILEAEGSGEVPPVLGAEGGSPPPMLQAQGSAGVPTLNQEAGMPDNIRQYLQHVERCESRRTSMASSQVADAVGMLTDLQGANMQGLFDEDGPPVEKMPSPTGKVIDSARNMRVNWDDLLRTFDSVQAPAECAAIKSYFDRVIRETGLMMFEITDAVSRAGSDRQQALRALMGMQGKSASRIDRPAREADALVAGVCGRYNTRKWFDITSDVGGGMLGR